MPTFCCWTCGETRDEVAAAERTICFCGEPVECRVCEGRGWRTCCDGQGWVDAATADEQFERAMQQFEREHPSPARALVVRGLVAGWDCQ